jgi:hypothetical protein
LIKPENAYDLRKSGQAALGLGVVGLHEREALRPAAAGGGGTAGDDLEPAILAGGLLAGVDVAAVQADHQRQIRPRQVLPVPRAGVDEAEALVAELVLQA